MFSRWMTVLRTCNAPEGEALDSITRWLVATRACVLSMTATSVLIGVLLAAQKHRPRLDLAVLVLAGLLLAHMGNNLLNDWLDARAGVDTDPAYPRADYAPHPLLGGLVTERDLLLAVGLIHLVAFLIGLYLFVLRGWLVALLAVLGVFLSVAYTAPPFALKRRGLGELTAFLVWGPLMTGGTYYVLEGAVDAAIFSATVPYGLLVGTVLLGKHLDKYDADRRKGIYTLPVLLGMENARWLTMVLMVGTFALVVLLVVLRVLPIWTMLVLLAVPRLVTVLRVYRRPRPAQPPPEWPIWPLWYVGWAMWLNRRVGLLFVSGLLLGAVLPFSIF